MAACGGGRPLGPETRSTKEIVHNSDENSIPYPERDILMGYNILIFQRDILMGYFIGIIF